MIDSMPRWALILLVSVSAFVIAVVSVVMLLVVDYDTCSGDGGSPFSADDSVAGRFCDGPLHVLWAMALLAVPVVVLVLIGVMGVARLRAALVAIGVGAGVAAVVALAAPVAALPSNCSDSDQNAYDRWIAGGRSGPPPADCETY
jgi:hypothetical protein